jgi:superfamily I DNA and RNA helicase
MEVIRGSARKPVSAERLTDVVEKYFAETEGVLYIGYPILSTVNEAISVDALIISRPHGVIAIHLVEGRDAGQYVDIQDEIANLLDAKFRQHKGLRSGRKLLVQPNTLTFAPILEAKRDDDGFIISNEHSIVGDIGSFTWDNPELYESVLSVIQSISTIRRSRRRRPPTRDHSYGAILQALEDSIANLDQRQSKAVIETVLGVQRIRGLAGSGKTIILALKAAYLHSQNPEWKIAVTFNTRSLKAQFNNLIETFVVEQTGERPNENIKVLNAWGAPGGDGRTGVYHQFCLANGVTYVDFQEARSKFGYDGAFKGVTELAVQGVRQPAVLYDAILIDEAQDFDPAFLRLCYHSLSREKRLVYAYDELQSLTDSSLPPPEELFGVDVHGQPYVTFDGADSSQDIILDKCYRNSRPVLSTAHALGFGIYRDPDPKLGTGLIQMFDRTELWKEVGYYVMDGDLADNQSVTLARTPATSPTFLEKPAEVDELIQFKTFSNAIEQAEWLAASIEKNLKEDDLRPEDIIVINPDPQSTQRQVGPVRKLLFERQIATHLAGVDTSSDVFFQPEEGSVAFTGIFRAKGNEAGMVYVMNSQDCFRSWHEIGRVRNRLFTAITRSKAWVRVVGHGKDMTALNDEYNRVKDHDFKLIFKYPDEALRKRLRVVNRDMSADEQKRVKSAQKNMATLVQDLNEGKVQLEDLPEDQVQALRKLLGQ